MRLRFFSLLGTWKRKFNTFEKTSGTIFKHFHYQLSCHLYMVDLTTLLDTMVTSVCPGCLTIATMLYATFSNWPMRCPSIFSYLFKTKLSDDPSAKVFFIRKLKCEISQYGETFLIAADHYTYACMDVFISNYNSLWLCFKGEWSFYFS